MSPYLLLYLSLPWLGGLALGRYLSQPVWFWLALAGLACAALFTLPRVPGGRLSLACLVALSLGAARFEAAQPPFGRPDFVGAYNERSEVALEGVVVALPDVRDITTQYRLRAERLITHPDGASRGVRGLALVTLPRFPAYAYGDRLRVSGNLETPSVFEDFSYREYLARHGIHAVLRQGRAERVAEGACDQFESLDCNPVLGSVYSFKAAALLAIARIFPEPQAALLSGILLGVETGIPAPLRRAFEVTGTSHIVAISGFNVSLIAGAFLFLGRVLAGPYARRRAAALALLGLAGYTLLVGADASVVRAALMGALALVAHLVGREVYAPGALAGAAGIMTLVNPLTLWDVGFQLSFMATLGLVLYAEPISGALLRLLGRFTALAADRRVGDMVGEYFGLTLAAQIATLPLTVYHFGRLPALSFPANGLILSAQPPVMILGGLAALAGVLWQPLGAVLAWLAWPFVTYTILVVEWAARWPGASLDLGPQAGGFLVGTYGLLFGLTWLAHAKPGTTAGEAQARGAGRTAAVLLAVLGLGALLIWSAVLAQPDGRLHVTFLDVGDGQAALVRPPSGEHVLLGGGASPRRLAEGLGRRLPFWQRRLALVVVPGQEGAQTQGLAGVLPSYRVDRALLTNAGPGRAAAYRELLDGLNRQGTPILQAEAGQEFDLGDGVWLRVLAVAENGLVAQVAWDRTSFLLPLGESGAALRALADARALAGHSVLLAPADGLDRALVEVVSPWAAVVSAGAGSVSGETLGALEGYTVLRTDRDGWVSFATDGQRLWAEAER